MSNPNQIRKKRDSIIHNTIWSSNLNKSKWRNMVENIMSNQRQPKRIPKLTQKILKYFKYNSFKNLNCRNFKLEKKILEDKKLEFSNKNNISQSQNTVDHHCIGQHLNCLCELCSKIPFRAADAKQDSSDLETDSSQTGSLSSCKLKQQNWQILRDIRKRFVSGQSDF